MSRLDGEVWKEYLEIRHEAVNHGLRAKSILEGHDVDYPVESANEAARAQVHATLAVAGRLECLCYILTKTLP
jgi:hypothetical protein